MTPPPSDAEQFLSTRYGEPAKEATDYVVRFQTLKGHVLAIHRTAQETRIWFQPPAPTTMAGIIALDYGMRGGKAKIKVRRALLYYALKRLGLDTDPGVRKPQDQQIVLVNAAEVIG